MLTIGRRGAYRFMWVVVTLAGCAVGAGGEPAAEPATAVPAATGGPPTTNPCTSLRLSAQHILGSETAVWLQIRLTNLGTEPVELAGSHSPLHDFAFVIVGPDGEPTPPTRWGRRWLNRSYGSFFTWVVPPDQSRIFVIELSRFFDLTLPGRYRIVVRRHVLSDKTLEAEAVEVTVPVTPRSLETP